MRKLTQLDATGVEVYRHFKKETTLQEFFEAERELYLKQAVADSSPEGRLRACGAVQAFDGLLDNIKKVKT